MNCLEVRGKHFKEASSCILGRAIADYLRADPGGPSAGFNRWKSAAITHGVYARYMAGQKSTEGIKLDFLRLSIEHSLMLSEQAVARLEG